VAVNVATWKSIMPGLSEMYSLLVGSGESVTMISNTGEWYVENFITDKAIEEQWEDLGYQTGIEIGKFRDDPCNKGNYTWVYYDDFVLEYDPVIRTCVFSSAKKVDNDND